VIILEMFLMTSFRERKRWEAQTSPRFIYTPGNSIQVGEEGWGEMDQMTGCHMLEGRQGGR